MGHEIAAWAATSEWRAIGGQYIVVWEVPSSNPGGTPIFGPLPFRGDSLETKNGGGGGEEVRVYEHYFVVIHWKALCRSKSKQPFQTKVSANQIAHQLLFNGRSDKSKQTKTKLDCKKYMGVHQCWSESGLKSLSPTKVRVSPDLSPDSAWSHEPNSRKVLYFYPTFNFCWIIYIEHNFKEPITLKNWKKASLFSTQCKDRISWKLSASVILHCTSHVSFLI